MFQNGWNPHLSLLRTKEEGLRFMQKNGVD